jgi:hypothetical protein
LGPKRGVAPVIESILRIARPIWRRAVREALEQKGRDIGELVEDGASCATPLLASEDQGASVGGWEVDVEHTEPNADIKILLHQLKLDLPPQPPLTKPRPRL